MVHIEKVSLGSRKVTKDIIMYEMARKAQRSQDGLNHFLSAELSRTSPLEIIEQVLELLEI